jgi:hypothetical protein
MPRVLFEYEKGPIFSEEVTKSKELTCYEKLTWAVLRRFQGDHCHGWPSYGSIALLSGMSKRESMRSVKSLEKKGWLEVLRTKEDGKNEKNFYACLIKIEGLSFPAGIAELVNRSGGKLSFDTLKAVSTSHPTSVHQTLDQCLSVTGGGSVNQSPKSIQCLLYKSTKEINLLKPPLNLPTGERGSQDSSLVSSKETDVVAQEVMDHAIERQVLGEYIRNNRKHLKDLSQVISSFGLDDTIRLINSLATIDSSRRSKLPYFHTPKHLGTNFTRLKSDLEVQTFVPTVRII